MELELPAWVASAPKAQSRRREGGKKKTQKPKTKTHHQAKLGHLSKLGRSNSEAAGRTDAEKISHPGLYWGLKQVSDLNMARPPGIMQRTQDPVLLLTCCVALGKFLPLSEFCLSNERTF